MTMSLNIRECIIPEGRPNRPSLPMIPEYITVHDTGNIWAEQTADSYTIYLNKYSDESAWHFTIDSKEIIQHLPLNENAWHCGDEEDGDGNRKSIGIEICMNEGGDREKAEKEAQKLIAKLMFDYNIPIENIVQHTHWNDLADCPILIRSRENGWEDFVEGVREYI